LHADSLGCSLMSLAFLVMASFHSPPRDPLTHKLARKLQAKRLGTVAVL